MRIQKNVVSFVAAGLLLVALPGTAGAPKIFALPNAAGDCAVLGTEGTYIGNLNAVSFDARGGELSAFVQLVAACSTGGPSIDSEGPVSATVLPESNATHLVISLAGTLGARPDENNNPTVTFDVRASLDIAAEKSATSIVKKVERNPDMTAAETAALLNKYLGVR